MKTKLTWWTGRTKDKGKWRKKYKGKIYYFSSGYGKSDREAEKKAIQEFEAIKARLSKTERTAS